MAARNKSGNYDPNFFPGRNSLGGDLDFSWVNARRANKRATLIGEFPTILLLVAAGSLISQGQMENCWFVAPLTNRSRDQQFVSTVLGPQPYKDGRSGYWHLRLRVDLRWVWFEIDPHFPYSCGVYADIAPIGNAFLWPAVGKVYAKNLGTFSRTSGGFYCEGMSALYDGFSIEYSLVKLVFEQLLRITLDGLRRGHKIGVSTIWLKEGAAPVVIPQLEDGHTLDLRAVVWGRVDGQVKCYFILRDPRRIPLKGSIYIDSPQWNLAEPPLQEALAAELKEIGTIAIDYEDLRLRVDFIHVVKPLPPVEEHFKSGPHEFIYNNRRGVFWTKTIQTQDGAEPTEGLLVTPPDDFQFPSELIGICNQQKRRRQGLKYLLMGLDLYKAQATAVPTRVRSRRRRSVATADVRRRSERALEFVCKDESRLELKPSLSDNAGGEVELFGFLLEGVELCEDSPQLLELLQAVKNDQDLDQQPPNAKKVKYSPP